MKLRKEQLHNLWTPGTLKFAQMLLNIFRNYPLMTNDQKQCIKPFFIIGSGRSGTTLLRTILCRHPLIVIPPETYGLVNAIKKYIRYNGLDWQDLVNVSIGEFLFHPTFQYWETDLKVILQDLYTTPKDDRSLALIINQIYQSYIKIHKPAATIWGDKTPFNTLRLKWIKRVFPEAKYIHLIRDGRDVVSSYVKSKLIPTVAEAGERWNNSLDAVDKFEKKLVPNRIFTLRYEDLVNKPEEFTQTICNFLSIEYLPKMIENTEVHLGDDVLDHLRNVKNPINIKSIGKWKKHLNADDQKLTISLIQDRLIKKGYSLD